MAVEYDKEYRNLIICRSKIKREIQSIALFIPKGLSGYHGSSYVRILLPFKHPSFREDYFPFTVDAERLDRESIEKIIADNDIRYVLIQRDGIKQKHADFIIGACKKNNIPIIYEIDDYLFGIERSHPDYTHYRGKLLFAKRMCQEADVVTVTTPQLKNLIQSYAKRVEVIPNSLDENLWFSIVRNRFSDSLQNSINVGYMGTYTHSRDLQVLNRVIPEVKRILKHRYGISMEFLMVGGMSEKPGQNIWYKRINIPNTKKEYPLFVRWLRKNVKFDIAVAPLEDNKLNRCKSELKFLEYTALGAAGIYSEIGGYLNTIKHGKTGFLIDVNDEYKWKYYLIELARKADFRKNIVKQARDQVVRHFLLKDRVHEWKTLLESFN
jgi:glycosyltransferase involved in cell wall biosynthesis